MASQVYNEFKRASASAEIDLDTAGDEIRIALLMTDTTADTENDAIVFISDFTTLDEFDGSGYPTPPASRKILANQLVRVDDPFDRAEFDTDNVTYTSLGAGTRSIAGALVYKHIGADTANRVVAWVEFSATPDGNDFTISWNVEGILQLT